MIENDYVITTRRLTKRFEEETAVADLDLEVPRGQTFGFIGPSGCGKTTTVRLLTGIYQPTSGEVSVLGYSPSEFGGQQQRQIGYLPQAFVLYPTLSVRENLNFVASLYGLTYRERRRRIAEMLDMVELTGHEKKVARDLSGGMQKRLSLAAALLHQPELIFLDEPTAGVDPILRRKFWDYFDYLEAQGRTLFVTTQYVSEAAYCDYVGLMEMGQLLMVDTPQGLRRRASGGDVIEIRLVERLDEARLAQLRDLPFIKRNIRVEGRTLHLVVDDAGEAMPNLSPWFQEQGLELEYMREHEMPIDDVFVRLLKNNGNGHRE